MSRENSDEASKITMWENVLAFPEDPDVFRWLKISDKAKEEGTTALECKIASSLLTNLFENYNVEEYQTESGIMINSEALSKIFSDMGEIETTMVVDNKTVQWKSIELDLKEIVQKYYEGIYTLIAEEYKGDKKIKIGKTQIDSAIIKITFDKFNEADFELADEAKSAKEVK